MVVLRNPDRKDRISQSSHIPASELRLQEANVIRHAIRFPHGVAVEIEYDVAVGTESFRFLRDPEIRTVEKLRLGCLGLRGQDEPLVDVSVRVGKIVSKRGESAMPDTTAFEAPVGVRIVQNQAVF